MSNINYIANLLYLRNPNLNFNKVIGESINGCIYKVVYATLTNKLDICPHCGERHINIHGYKSCTIKIMLISGYYAIIKQKSKDIFVKIAAKHLYLKQISLIKTELSAEKITLDQYRDWKFKYPHINL